MNKFFTYLILLLFNANLSAQYTSSNESKYGLIDKRGREVLPFVYDNIDDIIDGVVFAVKGGKYGLIDTLGVEKIPFIYDNISKSGCYYAGYVAKLNNEIQLFNNAGKEILNGEFDEITCCNEIFIVSKEGKLAVVSGDSSSFSQFVYDDIVCMNGSEMIVRIGDKYGLVVGTELEIPVEYEDIRLAETVIGLSVVLGGDYIYLKKNGKWGIQSFSTKEWIPFEYDYISDFNIIAVEKKEDTDTLLSLDYGIAIVKQDNKWGVLDTEGKEYIPLAYDSLSFINDTLLYAIKNNKIGIIDIRETEIIPFEYDSSEYIRFYLPKSVWFKKNDKWGLVDLKNTIVKPFIYNTNPTNTKDDIIEMEERDDYLFLEGLELSQANGKWGIKNLAGSIIIPIIYDSLEDIHWTRALLASKDGKWGAINYNNDELLPFNYDEIDLTGQSFAVVKKDGKWGCIDGKNNVLLPFEYDEISYLGSNESLIMKDGKFGFFTDNEENGVDISECIYDWIHVRSYDGLYIARKLVE